MKFDEVWCKKQKEAPILEISGLDNAEITWKVKAAAHVCLQAAEVSFSAAFSCASTPYLSTASTSLAYSSPGARADYTQLLAGPAPGIPPIKAAAPPAH